MTRDVDPLSDLTAERDAKRPDAGSEHFPGAAAALLGPFEPRNPCRMFETRACVDLSEDPVTWFRVDPCPPRECRRFPGLDS